MTHEQYESKSQMKRVEILKAEKKQMTHEELLAKLSFGRVILKDDVVAQLKALRAVVELHKQIDDNSCHHCATWYPCPTIEAIEKELK